MNDDIRKKIALFRYSLIAPLITSTFTQKSAKAYFEEIRKKINMPGTTITGVYKFFFTKYN